MKKKIKELIEKAVSTVSSVIDWFATDGLLHILVVFAIFNFLASLIPAGWALLIAEVIGLVWELRSLVTGKGTGTAAWKDILCDNIGLVFGLINYMLYVIKF